MPEKPCKGPTVVPALLSLPWQEQGHLLPPLPKPQTSQQLSLLLPEGEQRHRAPLYLSPAQQAATRKCRGPGMSSPHCDYRQTHSPAASPLGKRHFPREGTVASSLAPPKEIRASWEKLDPPYPLQIHPGTSGGIGCSEVFSHLRFLTIPDSIAERSNHTQSRQRTKGTFTCCAQRLLAPQEHTCAHPQVPAAASATDLVSTQDPGSQRPTPPPDLSCPHRASSRTWVGQGSLSSTTWPLPLSPHRQSPWPHVVRATLGSQSHQSLEHVGMAGTCLWALRLSLLTKGANSEGLSQLEEYGS